MPKMPKIRCVFPGNRQFRFDLKLMMWYDYSACERKDALNNMEVNHMENMSWIIPTVAVVISSGALWFRITKQAVIIATKIATKEDLEKHRAETKEDLEKHRAETKEDFERLRMDFDKLRIDFERLRLDVEKYRLETKEDLDKLRSEMKSEHAELARKVESLNSHFIDHLSFHADRSD